MPERHRRGLFDLAVLRQLQKVNLLDEVGGTLVNGAVLAAKSFDLRSTRQAVLIQQLLIQNILKTAFLVKVNLLQLLV